MARVQLVRQHAVRHRHDPDDGHVLDADRLRHLVQQGCDAGTLGEIRHGSPEGERLDITDCEVERLGHLDADRRLAGPGGQATRLDGRTVHVGVPPVGGPADHHLRPSLPELRTAPWCPVVVGHEEQGVRGDLLDAGEGADRLLDLPGVGRRVDHHVADIGSIEVGAVGVGGPMGRGQGDHGPGGADGDDQYRRDHRHPAAAQPGRRQPAGRRPARAGAFGLLGHRGDSTTRSTPGEACLPDSVGDAGTPAGRPAPWPAPGVPSPDGPGTGRSAARRRRRRAHRP